MAVQL